MAFRQSQRAQIAFSKKRIFNFLSKIVLQAQVINFRVLREGIELDYRGRAIGSASAKTPPLLLSNITGNMERSSLMQRTIQDLE